MNRKFVFTLLIVALCGNAFGQRLKYRFGVNAGRFKKEIGTAEIPHPLIAQLSNPEATDFTSNLGFGYEGELMMLFTPFFETGIELDYTKLSGYNDVPPYYNYYFAPNNPSVITTTEPLIYNTSAVSLLANARFYLFPEKKINPFVKAFAGLSFVGTEFNYRDTASRNANNVDALYAVGTKNSTDPKKVAFHYGIGAGINFKMSDKVSIYLDGTMSVINSDIVDGIPNYNYYNVEGTESLLPAANKALVTQFSIGFVFWTNTNLGIINGGNKKMGGGKARGSGTTSKYYPFYRKR